MDICLSIGGINIIVISENRTFIQALGRRYTGFTPLEKARGGDGSEYQADADGYSPEVNPSLAEKPPSRPARKELKERSSLTGFIAEDRLLPTATISINHKHPPLGLRDIRLWQEAGLYFLESDDCTARIDLGKKDIQAQMPARAGVFDCFLRVVFSLLLLEYDGFLLHAAGLSRDNRGYVFTGPSSSGKTTLAGSATDFNVLSDELVIIKKDGGKFLLFSTPFAGEFKGRVDNCCALLEIIFFLRKNIPGGYAVLEKQEMLISLLENIFFFARDYTANQKIIRIGYELCYFSEGYSLDLFSKTDVRRVIYEITASKAQRAGSLAGSGR